MKALAHLTLLSLLFVTSAAQSSIPALSSITNDSTHSTTATTTTSTTTTPSTTPTTLASSNSTTTTPSTTPTTLASSNSTTTTPSTTPTTLASSNSTTTTPSTTPTTLASSNSTISVPPAAQSSIPALSSITNDSTHSTTATTTTSTTTTPSTTPTTLASSNSTTTTPSTTPTTLASSNSTTTTPSTTPTTLASSTSTATPTPSTSVSVSSTVPVSTVTSTESKSSTVAKTSPIGNTTTKTTSPVSGNSSSIAPSPTTQMSNNGSTVTPITQNNSSEAVTPVTSGNVTSSKISTTNSRPTVPINPCQGAPCKGGSSCVTLNDTHICLCTLGYYYNSSTCKKGKLFPGSIRVKVSEVSGLGDENSVAYQRLHIQITNFFKNAFDNSDYGQTVIDKVSTSPSARSAVRAGDKTAVVEVLNIFTETTKESEKTVSQSIRKAIQNSSGDIAGYNPQTLCDYYGCEKENEHDDCSNGLLCKCKQGMERPNPQVPVCVVPAVKCPDTCNADNNEQCLVNKSGGNPECVCLPGYKKDDRGVCQECAFGYSGVNCEDNFQLILTVVGSIGGALILCLVIALIFLASPRNKNKNIEEQNLIENDFQNLRLQQTTGFSNLGADGSIFPKVRANVSGQPPNPYAHQRSMPRPDY
ncbi:mucin-13 isoform X3 [Halichoerus grypus]